MLVLSFFASKLIHSEIFLGAEVRLTDLQFPSIIFLDFLEDTTFLFPPLQSKYIISNIFIVLFLICFLCISQFLIIYT